MYLTNIAWGTTPISTSIFLHSHAFLQLPFALFSNSERVIWLLQPELFDPTSRLSLRVQLDHARVRCREESA
jgi:hypothetical protein